MIEVPKARSMYVSSCAILTEFVCHCSVNFGEIEAPNDFLCLSSRSGGVMMYEVPLISSTMKCVGIRVCANCL